MFLKKEERDERLRLLGMILGALSQVTAEQWRELAFSCASSDESRPFLEVALLLAELREKAWDEAMDDPDLEEANGGPS